MELKEGYKQTEVGVIPSDWEVSPLEAFTSFISYGFTNPMPTSESGVHMITAKDINSGKIQFDTARCTTEEAYRTLLTAKSRPKKGDLLLTKDGTLGRLALVGDRTVCVNQSVAVLRPNTKAIPEFLKVLLEAPAYQNRMLEDAGGSTIKHIYITIVNRMPLVVPSTKAEQTAIATVLSDADALMQSLEKLIAKKRNIKQGAMQELLKPKEGWVVKKLGSLFEITSSKRVFQREWKAEGIPFYRAREIAVLGETGHINNDLFITRDMYVTFKKTYGVPNIGDMLVTGVGTLGKTYVISDNHEFYFKDGNVIWFKIAGTVCTEFLRQLYLTPFVIKQIANASAGTTVGTYTISGAKRTTIPLPPSLAEQTHIATILSDMDAEISALETKLAKYKQIKQGMMQNLLTGKIRLV